MLKGLLFFAAGNGVVWFFLKQTDKQKKQQTVKQAENFQRNGYMPLTGNVVTAFFWMTQLFGPRGAYSTPFVLLCQK